MGVDEELACDPSTLLRQAYDLAKGLFDVRYGFALKMPLADEPDCYAAGHVKASASEAFQMIHNRREWDSRQKTPDELWSEELYERQRHMTGLFRSAYPASILSDTHLETSQLRSQSIGTLSELDPSLWLWELAENEIQKAEAILREKSALVSQAAHA